MRNRLLHQCGHYSVWNLDSFLKDGCGDGLILSPVHTSIRQMQGPRYRPIRQHSIFDPQFYLPNSQKRNLLTYHFYPEVVSNGTFDMKVFRLEALQAAKRCIEFQIELGFESIVIPALNFEEIDPDYIDIQEEYTVTPFLKAISDLRIKKDVFLTIPITMSMVLHGRIRTELLNWVTSFPELAGVYVVPSKIKSTAKQITSDDFIFNYLEFLTNLRNANLRVIAGYCNVEALLYSIIDGVDVTFGTFENTRLFSMDKFIVSDEERRGPRARIFLPGLLNWIQFNHAREIREENKDLWDKIYRATSYAEKTFVATGDPHFGQPALYKHHFEAFQHLWNLLKPLNVEGRYRFLRERLKRASQCYDEIEGMDIELDRHSLGSHIQPWQDALNKYYRRFIKSGG